MVCDRFHDESEYGFNGREYTHRRLAVERINGGSLRTTQKLRQEFTLLYKATRIHGYRHLPFLGIRGLLKEHNIEA